MRTEPVALARSGAPPSPKPSLVARLAGLLDLALSRIDALEKAPPLRTIASARLTPEGDLVLIYSDATESNLGRLALPAPLPAEPSAALLARIEALETALAASTARKKTKTTVTKKNDDGTIAEFVQEDL